MTAAQYNEYQRQADVIEEEKKRLAELSKQDMTAVEWLRNELWEQFKFSFSDNIFEQAKEMEKQQIIRGFIDGEENVWDRKKEGHEFVFDNHEEYYSKNYGSEKSKI